MTRIVSGEKDPVKVSFAINDAARRLDTTDVRGDTTGSNANAGNIGEIVEADVPLGSEVALTTATAANVTSISLTAGDWDIAGIVLFAPGASTSTSAIAGSISSTSATLDTTKGRFSPFNFASGGIVTGGTRTSSLVMPCRFNLAATTTIYLVALAVFTISTMGAAGHIRARRVR